MKKSLTNKLSILFLFTLLTSCILSGCSLLTFDASGYVKACLDANTRGEFKEYTRITKISEEDAAKTYNDLLDQAVTYLDSYNLSEEKMTDFRELCANIYKSFKYEVGEAVKNEDDSYSVPVTTYKLQIFRNFVSEGEAFITDYVNQAVEAGNSPSEDEIYAAVADYMYNTLSANLEALEYAEPVTTTVTVSPSKQNSQTVYSISQADLQNLLQALIDIENAQ